MKKFFKQPFSSPLKRFLLLSFFTILSLQSMAGAIISIYLEIGRPSRDCAGISICHFKITLEDDRILGTVQSNGKELILSIKNDAFIGHENAIQSGYFINEEDVLIPTDITKELGIAQRVVFKTGKYAARRTSTGYTIRFPIE